ncbi:MAG TPA: hypothetical protein VFJ43_08055, partial [Bacteroidia bacterium]|nr:hypothetical protein [Bacteroidia bacterium]
VSPGNLTMVQFKQFLDKGKFDCSLSGPLVIFNYRKLKFDTTRTTFTVTYTYHSNDKTTYEVKSSNLPLKGIADHPDVWTEGSSVGITYEENMVRPLEFYGYAIDDPRDGKTYRAIFILKEPEHLDSTMFYQYLENPAVGPIWYRMTIIMSDGTKYHIDRDRYSGQIGNLVMGNDSIECATGGPPSTTDTSFYKFGDYWNPSIVLALDKLKKGIKDTGEIGINNPDELELLEMTDFTGHLYVKENGVMVNKGKCKIVLDGIFFSGNMNYGK